MRAFQLVFGVVAGMPIAASHMFMLPNIDLLFSENLQEITTADYIRHYLFYSGPIIGYASLVFAYLRRSAYPPVLKYIVSSGLMVGILFAGGATIHYLKPVFGFIFLNYTGYGLWFDIIFSSIAIGLVISGTTLLAPILCRRTAELSIRK